MIYRKEEEEDVLITIGRMLFFDKMVTGRQPTHIYLGEKEWGDVREFFVKSSMLKQCDDIQVDTLMGLEVVHVKRESYIGFGG